MYPLLLDPDIAIRHRRIRVRLTNEPTLVLLAEIVRLPTSTPAIPTWQARVYAGSPIASERLA